jgi:tape measure domain-containing protein
MIVRELITKLSYMVDNSGLKKFNDGVASAINSVNNQLRNVQNGLAPQGLTKKLKADMREIERFKERSAIVSAKRLEKAQTASLLRTRERANLALEVMQDKANKRQLIRDQNTTGKIARMRMDSAERIALFQQRKEAMYQKNKEITDRRFQDAQARRAIRSTETIERRKSEITRRMTGYTGMTLSAVGVAGMIPIVTGFKRGLKSLIDTEVTQGALGASLGSAEKGKATQLQFESFASNTPLSQEAVNDVGKSMIALKFTSDEAIKRMGQLGDVAVGNNDMFVRIAKQYRQIQMRGYAYWEDLNRVSDAGVIILPTLAENLGKTNTELMKMVKNREVTADMVNTALDTLTGKGGNYNNRLNDMMLQLGGKIDRQQDSITLALRDAVEVLKPVIVSFLEITTWLADSFRSMPKILKLLSMLPLLLAPLTLFSGMMLGLAHFMLNVVMLLSSINAQLGGRSVKAILSGGFSKIFGKGKNSSSSTRSGGALIIPTSAKNIKGRLAPRARSVKNAKGLLKGAKFIGRLGTAVAGGATVGSLGGVPGIIAGIVSALIGMLVFQAISFGIGALINSFSNKDGKSSAENAIDKASTKYLNLNTSRSTSRREYMANLQTGNPINQNYDKPIEITANFHGLPEGDKNKEQYLKTVAKTSLDEYFGRMVGGLQADTVGVR